MYVMDVTAAPREVIAVAALVLLLGGAAVLRYRLRLGRRVRLTPRDTLE